MSQILIFSSNNQEYSIDIRCVKEIRNWINSTPVPDSSEFLEGIINIRGSVIPLIDFSKKINASGMKHEKKAIIVVEGNNKIISFSVEDVLEILDFEQENLKDFSNLNLNENCSFFEGIINLENRNIFKIDESLFIKDCINGD